MKAQTPPLSAFLKLDTGTHTACIHQLALTPDGESLVSAGECTIRVWDRSTKRQRLQLLGQAGERSEELWGNGNVQRFAICPDGRHLIALKAWYDPALPGADEGRSTELQVFELANGNLRSRFALPGLVDEVEVSPDGRWLVLGGLERVGSLRRGRVDVYATAAVLRAGFPERSPQPRASFRLGQAASDSLFELALRFLPGRVLRGQPCQLLVALGGEQDGSLHWLEFDLKQGMSLRREVLGLGPLSTRTLAVSSALAVVARADTPRQGRSRAGMLLWMGHDAHAPQGRLRTDTVPASAVFSVSGGQLLLGLSPWTAGGAQDGREMAAVHAYAVTTDGLALRCSYFGHDGEVMALCLDGMQAISAGGDHHAIHFWDASHRIGQLTAAIRGLGQGFFAPGINAREQVLFGTVPERLLPPRQAARQQAFDLRRLQLRTTRSSELSVSDFESAKWFIYDSGAQLIGLRHSPDAWGDELDKPPDLSLFVARNDEWVIWTRSGFYAASPGGERLMGYHLNRGPKQEALFLPADRFKDFYRPDLVRAVVRHGSEARAAAAGVALPAVDLTALLPPHLELLHQRRTGQLLELSVAASWAGEANAPSKVWLLRNGRFVASFEEARHEYRFKLRLLPGDNQLTLLAENKRSRSLPLRLSVPGPAPLQVAHQQEAASGRLFLLAVGVSEFAVAGTPLAQGYQNLPYPHRDAISIFNALAASKRGPRRAVRSTRPVLVNRAFDGVEAALLVNEEASKAAVLRELDHLCDRMLARAEAPGAERDVLFVFLAGHGVRFPNDPELFFWTHDMVPERMDETGLSMVELGERLSHVPAEVVLVIDTCHSAMAGNNMLRAFSPEELARRVQAVSERGMYVMSAARSEERAQDSHVHAQGVFTAALLQALDAETEAAGRKGVRMLAWMDRAQELMPQVMRQAGTTPQAPVLRMYGDLLPFTLFKR